MVCIVSRAYSGPSSTIFWFAFHPHQLEFLKSHARGTVVIGCGSEDVVLSVPISDWEEWLAEMNVTDRAGRFSWHVKVQEIAGKFVLLRRAGAAPIDLSEYVLPPD